MLEAQTANTIELAHKLPPDMDRSDLREQWLRRLLSNHLLRSTQVMEPFAQRVLASASAHGQVIQLSMDQTDLSDQFAILMISVRVGDRALPLCWQVEAGAANIGFESQRLLLETLWRWLPSERPIMLSADRF